MKKSIILLAALAHLEANCIDAQCRDKDRDNVKNIIKTLSSTRAEHRSSDEIIGELLDSSSQQRDKIGDDLDALSYVFDSSSLDAPPKDELRANLADKEQNLREIYSTNLDENRQEFAEQQTSLRENLTAAQTERAKTSQIAAAMAQTDEAPKSPAEEVAPATVVAEKPAVAVEKVAAADEKPAPAATVAVEKVAVVDEKPAAAVEKVAAVDEKPAPAATVVEKPAVATTVAVEKPAPAPDTPKSPVNNQSLAVQVALNAAAKALAAGYAEQAHKILQGVCAHRCDDVGLNFGLIRTAMATKDYDTALAASDRVLIYDPHNANAHLAAAQVYKKQGNDALLRAELEELRANAQLSQQQKEAIARLAANDKLDAYAMLALGFSNESNAQHLAQDGFDYHTPFGTLRIDGDEPEHASSLILSATAGVFSQLGERTMNDLSLSVFSKKFFKPKDDGYSNISVFSLGENISHKFNERFRLLLGLNYDYAILKSSPYSHTFSADLGLKTKLDNGFELKTGIAASSANYVQAEDKDDKYYHYAIYQQFSKYFSRALIYARTSFEKERASASRSISSDYDTFAASINGVYQLTSALSANAKFSYEKNKYLKFHSGFGNKRNDEIYRFGVGLDYAFSQRQNLSFSAGYTTAQSNQGLYDYDNYVFSIFYRLTFN